MDKRYNCAASAPASPPSLYQVIATPSQVIILFFGLFGNLTLIFMVFRTKNLHTSTFSYLVSLAFADLVILLSAVPDSIVYNHIGLRWITGQVGCSLLVFCNFLGLTASSLSILAFTIDRFIAVCRPLQAARICTVHFAKRIIGWLWMFAILYCAPWLALAELKQEKKCPDNAFCGQRLPRDQYVYLFVADFVLFYLVPLVIAGWTYTKLGIILYQSVQAIKAENIRLNSESTSATSTSVESEPISTPSLLTEQDMKQRGQAILRCRANVLRMLIVIVIIYAASLLPFRGLMVFECFSKTPYQHLWYSLFAKTMIFLNSAINPFVYSAMNRRFKIALYRMIASSCEWQAD